MIPGSQGPACEDTNSKQVCPRMRHDVRFTFSSPFGLQFDLANLEPLLPLDPGLLVPCCRVEGFPSLLAVARRIGPSGPLRETGWAVRPLGGAGPQADPRRTPHWPRFLSLLPRR